MKINRIELAVKEIGDILIDKISNFEDNNFEIEVTENVDFGQTNVEVCITAFGYSGVLYKNDKRGDEPDYFEVVNRWIDSIIITCHIDGLQIDFNSHEIIGYILKNYPNVR